MLTDKKGKSKEVVLTLKYKRIKVLPPIGKRKRYPDLPLTDIQLGFDMATKLVGN